MTDRLSVGWNGQREEKKGRQAMCVLEEIQEIVPGICAGGSILSVSVEKEGASNILVLSPFFPCLIIITITSQN